jgi:type I restriction enzyme S subunit
MTVQHLRVGGVETLLVPLPPLAEQHRIVAKVDKIMELCETLEASLVAGEETRSKLLKAVLANSLEPA